MRSFRGRRGVAGALAGRAATIFPRSISRISRRGRGAAGGSLLAALPLAYGRVWPARSRRLHAGRARRLKRGLRREHGGTQHHGEGNDFHIA